MDTKTAGCSMWQIPDKVNGAKVRKKGRGHTWDATIGAHTTINGLGKVSGLVKKHSRKGQRC